MRWISPVKATFNPLAVWFQTIETRIRFAIVFAQTNYLLVCAASDEQCQYAMIVPLNRTLVYIMIFEKRYGKYYGKVQSPSNFRPAAVNIWCTMLRSVNLISQVRPANKNGIKRRVLKCSLSHNILKAEFWRIFIPAKCADRWCIAVHYLLDGSLNCCRLFVYAFALKSRFISIESRSWCPCAISYSHRSKRYTTYSCIRNLVWKYIVDERFVFAHNAAIK